MGAGRFRFEVFSLRDFTNPALINRVLDLFDSLPGALRPSRFGPHEPVSRIYDRENRQETVSTWLNGAGIEEYAQSGCLCLEGDPPSMADYFVDWDNSALPRFNMVTGRASVRGNAMTGGLRDLVRLASDLVTETDAVFALINRELPQTSNLLSRNDLNVRLPDPCWIMYFGSPYIELFGEDALRSAPCPEIVELPSGHFCLVATTTPYDPVPEEAKQRLREHFGLSAFREPNKPIRSTKVGVVPSFNFNRKRAEKD